MADGGVVPFPSIESGMSGKQSPMMALQAENMHDEEERGGISGSYKGSATGPQYDDDQDVIPLTPSKLKSSKFSPRSVKMRALTQFFSLTGTSSSSSPVKSAIQSPRKFFASILKRPSTTTTASETQDSDNDGSSHSPSDTDSLCSSAIFGPSVSDDEDVTRFTSEMQARRKQTLLAMQQLCLCTEY